jgi:thioredoxin 1
MVFFEKMSDKDGEGRERGNQGRMLEPPRKKKGNFSSRVFLLSLAVVIVAGIAYRFWPNVESLWQTAKAAVALHEDAPLTGILYTEDKPLALVGGHIAGEGDVVGGVKVLKIHKDNVEFERSGKRWVQHMSDAEEASSSLPVLLQVGSHKCRPCKRMEPILDKLRSKYAGKFQVRSVDMRRDKTAGTKYGVRATPTQIFYDSKGREVYRHVGFCSKKDILATWKTLGVKL